jgi:hypothetical protein
MTTIVTRAGKGMSLTHAEMDANLNNLNNDKQEHSANLDEYAAVNPTAAGLALLDDADAAAQRTTLGLDTLEKKNFVINGGCQIAQRGNINVVNNAVTYGGCDRISVCPSSFTTCTGTIGQSTSADSVTNCGQSATVTTTGTGGLYFRTLLEAANTKCLSGKTVTFSFIANQTTGSNLDVYPFICSADVADVFSAVTVVSTGPTV